MFGVLAGKGIGGIQGIVMKSRQSAFPPLSTRAKLKVMAEDLRKTVGLCERCRHVRMLRSDRSSIFYQCALSFTDMLFRKYPTLPVLFCLGHEPIHFSEAPLQTTNSDIAPRNGS
jgi:hypothetical protein